MEIVLRFVDTQESWVSGAIRRAELGFPYSHVEAVTKSGNYLGSLLNGGVQERPNTYDTTWTQQLFVKLPATDIQYADFYGFLQAQIGCSYDQGAIIEIISGIITGDQFSIARKWICSALQVAGLIKIGLIKSAPASIRLTTPRDVLCMCAALTTIGEPEHAKV